MDSQSLLDDVGLVRKLLENASRQEGRLSGADIVFGLRNLLWMEYYPVAVDGCAAFDEHPFTMTLSVNSSVCLGCVRCRVPGRPNAIPMCSGSKTAGKTEQGEWNWIWPGGHLEPTFRWTLERTIRDGGVSFPRTGETYPGFDLCKLCGFVAFEATERQA